MQLFRLESWHFCQKIYFYQKILQNLFYTIVPLSALSNWEIIHKWCPIFLSHFWPPLPPLIRFLPSIIQFFEVILDPTPPPLKSDIIYERSLRDFEKVCENAFSQEKKMPASITFSHHINQTNQTKNFMYIHEIENKKIHFFFILQNITIYQEPFKNQFISSSPCRD